jgi:hypothetical protein
MSHFLTSDDKYRELIYGDDYRSYYLTDRTSSPVSYKFGRIRGKRLRARNALRRFGGYFRSMVAAIADAKLRRMERELELHGGDFDCPSDDWVVRKSQPTERS